MNRPTGVFPTRPGRTVAPVSDINGIIIRHVIYEDHLAKTFQRPEWRKYLLDLRRGAEKRLLIAYYGGV